MRHYISEQVAALEREIEYQNSMLEEAKAVIAQLSSGFQAKPSSDLIYIHPYDLAELINNAALSCKDFLDIYVPERPFTEAGVVKVGTVKYKQSVLMPQRQTSIR